MSTVNRPENTIIRMLARLTRSLPIGRGVDQKRIQTTGWSAHQDAVGDLVYHLREVPSDRTVRLKKKTSNLFRGRSESTSETLEVEGLRGVIAIDPFHATADVQGMCTFEDLVDATLPFGLMPLVVPNLKTITIGGAVAGLGVESTSFRNGLSHESVLEMDILTGTGEVVTCSPEENADLYRGFPNSYGTLGYAVRVKIELEPVLDYVELRHVRFDDLAALVWVLTEVSETGRYEGQQVDYLDGVVLSPTETYLIMGTQTAEPGPVSNYTRDRIYYRSIKHPTGITHDRLNIRDYIWRWDTDWLWGLHTQDPQDAQGSRHLTSRKFWPRDLLHSSFYWKLIGLDRKFHVTDRLEKRAGRPAREHVVHNIEITTDRLEEFLTWVLDTPGIAPLWLCPIRLRDGADTSTTRPWSLYPATSGVTWVMVGILSSVPVGSVAPPGPVGGDEPVGSLSREIEKRVAALGGHTSLFSESFYTREHFEELYGGGVLEQLKKKFDPGERFPGLYEKTVGGQ